MSLKLAQYLQMPRKVQMCSRDKSHGMLSLEDSFIRYLEPIATCWYVGLGPKWQNTGISIFFISNITLLFMRMSKMLHTVWPNPEASSSARKFNMIFRWPTIEWNFMYTWKIPLSDYHTGLSTYPKTLSRYWQILETIIKDSKESHGDTGMHINYSFSCTARPSKELSCSGPGLCSSVNICLWN